MIMSLTSEYDWNGKSYTEHKREIYLGTFKYDSNGLLNFAETIGIVARAPLRLQRRLSAIVAPGSNLIHPSHRAGDHVCRQQWFVTNVEAVGFISGMGRREGHEDQ